MRCQAYPGDWLQKNHANSRSLRSPEPCRLAPSHVWFLPRWSRRRRFALGCACFGRHTIRRVRVRPHSRSWRDQRRWWWCPPCRGRRARIHRYIDMPFCYTTPPLPEKRRQASLTYTYTLDQDSNIQMQQQQKQSTINNSARIPYMHDIGSQILTYVVMPLS